MKSTDGEITAVSALNIDDQIVQLMFLRKDITVKFQDGTEWV